MSMVDQASNFKSVSENLYLKDVHYIEVPESLYNKIPCCGQYEDKQNEYLYLY